MSTLYDRVNTAVGKLEADAQIQHDVSNGAAGATVTTEGGQVRTVANAIATLMATVPRGGWLTATAYAVRDLVTQSSVVYICVVAHTSGTFATDLAAGKWAIFSGPADEGSLASGFGRQRRGGTTAQHAAFTGLVRELTVDTDLKTVRVHDGSLAGGVALQPYLGANALLYGAKRDGATDDFAALQAGITASAGGIFYVPAGNYKLTDALVVPSNTLVKCAGIGVTTFTQVTNNKGVFAFTDASNSEVRDCSIVGGPASSATAVISIYCSAANIQYVKARNVDIQSLGNLGIGVHLRSTASKFVGFCAIENVTVCGGGAGAYNSKIGYKIGSDDGSVHTVRTHILGGRVWRCNKGILLDNCDTTTSHGLGLDDVNGNGLDFNRASGCDFSWVSFENGTFGKYINFGSNSADNNVKGFLANATPSQLTDAGTRNSWSGLDGSGGVQNKITGPVNVNGNLGLLSKGAFADFASGGDSLPAIADGAQAKWQAFPLTTSNVTNAAAIAEAFSYVQQAGGIVSWHFRIQFNASVAGNNVTVQIPVMPHLAAYRQYGSIGPMMFPGVGYGAGAALVPLFAKFPHQADSSGVLTIYVPTGNWYTSGTYNQIYFCLQYKAQGYTS